MPDCDRSRPEQGSIALTILAAIVLGGLVVALFATVQIGTTSAGRDRDFHQAIQVADAGIQEAYVVLSGVQPDADPPCDADGDGFCTGTLSDGKPYRWSYERIGEFLWNVESIGEFRGAERSVHARIGQTPLYEVAMLTRRYFTYNGGGGGTDPFVVGTFGDATLNGDPAINSIAAIVLYGDGPHNVNVPPETVPQQSDAEGPDLPNIALDAFAEDGECADEPFYSVYPADVPTPGVRGQIYCVGRIDFGNNDHVLTGPSDESVTIFVDPNGASALTMTGNGEVNWDLPRDASQLQIYAAGGDVTVGGNSRLAAAVWAPASACTSNGGTSVAGAMVCNTATLNGNFSYDAQVQGIQGTEFRIRGWREEYVR